MSIDQNIINNHALTSQTAIKFLDYAITQERCLQTLALLDPSLPGIAGNYAFPLQSWPWFINRQAQQMLEKSACQIPSLIYRAVRAEFAGDARRFAAFFNLPEVLGEIFIQSGMNLAQQIVRVDAMLTARGLKIMEINAGPNVGGWQIQWLDPQYRKNPALAPFFADLSFTTTNIPLEYMKLMVRQGQISQGSKALPVHTLFVVEDLNGLRDLEFSLREVYQQALQELGAQGEIHFEANFKNLRFAQNHAILNGQRIAALAAYRSKEEGRSKEEQERSNRENQTPLELYRSFLSGKIAWPGNPFAVVIGDKRSLSITNAQKDKGIFTVEEKQLIESYLPWSSPVIAKRVTFDGVEIELKDLLLQRREDFVIKIARGSAGKDVFVGRFQNDQEWQAIVERVFTSGDWLAQEYCQSLAFYGQGGAQGYAVHDVVWGIFSFGMQYGGCWLRLMPKDSGDGVINSATGAMETIVYEVED